MKLKLRSILAAGDLRNERLTLRAESDLDLGEYAVLQVPLIGRDLMTDVFHTFWFPYQEIERGDLVVIYTKKGEVRSKMLETGSRAHFFYWNVGEAIWNDSERAAVVLRAADWAHKGTAELRK